ncbi:hypothetical protein DL96DRAFT_1457952 [Flagelloscypha sp. PMI_526]|nr:hypothetical protein DL96DRAFT_1457952 [Flagelloscypha sp. PMI_526]
MVQLATRFLLASSVLLGLVAAGPVRLSREDLAVRALGHLLGRGSQFITGPCTSDSDCAAGCCGFNTGKCAGPIVALQRDGGCGFGDAQANDDAARKLGFTGGITSASTDTSANNSASSSSSQTTGTSSTGSGKAPGTQFITGPCASDSECASGRCCGFNTGKCAGAIIALQRDGGCGFGDAKANDNAAQKLGFTGGITSPSTGPQNAGASSTTTDDNDTSSDNSSNGDDSSSSASASAAAPGSFPFSPLPVPQANYITYSGD